MHELESIHVTIGLRRAGTHAIAGWLLSHLAGKEIKADGIHLARDVSVIAEGVTYANNVEPSLLKKLILRDPLPGEKHRVIGVEICGFDVKAELPEDHPAQDARVIVILRNPINHLASTIKGGHNFDHVTCGFPRHWKECLEFYRGLQADGYKCLGANFDQWFQNRQYREDLASRMGFANEELGLGIISGNGGGSSFDQLEKDGKAQEMNVLGRWMEYVRHEEYMFVIKFLREDIEKEFGPLPEELIEGFKRWG
jgi:hypothetical protein